MTTGYLHTLCGKIAAGKSTLAKELSSSPKTVLISEDEWLSRLFGPEMATIKDYVRCSARLRAVLAPHIAALLKAGLSVVVDFPANTPETRVWMKQLSEETGCDHTLHFLNVSDEICRERLRDRNTGGGHEFTVSDEQFEAITRHFVAPDPSEGFEIKEYREHD
ncbi:ATP-binding protein [Roseibium sp.]|uniref:AAA family ATPase n=1 Tax=Roseibium sp. TaxID=1936156 RepID=UPI00329A2974